MGPTTGVVVLHGLLGSSWVAEGVGVEGPCQLQRVLGWRDCRQGCQECLASLNYLRQGLLMLRVSLPCVHCGARS
jgi:hypothetical protein